MPKVYVHAHALDCVCLVLGIQSCDIAAGRYRMARPTWSKREKTC